MVTSESQRMAYLKVMGVQAYFPRRPLPGALPVRHYAEGMLRKDTTSASAIEPGPASAQDVLNMLAERQSSEHVDQKQLEAKQVPLEAASATQIEAPTAQPKAIPPVVEVIPSASESSLEEEEARFVFAYFPINEHFAVINELPWSKAASVTTSCRKLLADILKALGVEVPERNLNPMVFTWPIFEGAPADLDNENARQTLEGFVAKRLRLLPVKTLLVLAEQSADLLFPRGFLNEQGPHLRHPRHDVEVVLTHSLNAMEAVPDLKRTVWKTLQPLRGKLHGTGSEPQDGVS